jgi:holliday junction DNA helicase RuvA
MISRIAGQIAEAKDNMLIISMGGLGYEVMMPRAVMKAMEGSCKKGLDIELVVYHYYQMTASRAVPVLIGFQNDIEREFFEKFISVSGVGPKAACKALAEPFSSIAGAIDSGDIAFLKRLPGIGERKAGEIVAKLKGKVGKYGLIRDGLVDMATDHEDDRDEAVSILLQLQYKKNEAEDMVAKAIQRNPDAKTSEAILNEVYRERKEV